MNLPKKGPDLKLSEVKVPDFVLDVYYDLKERHLLPVVVVLVVAIVAVPIALSESASSEGSTVSPSEGVATPSTAGAQTGELVATSAPGLRDYRRRLRHLSAKDPFEQQYQEREPSPSTGSSAEGGGAESAEPTSSPESFSAPPSPETEEGTSGTPGNRTYYSYAIDVRVSAGGSQDAETSEDVRATVRHNLPELTMLPSRQTPAIVYMGSTRDGKKALMLVSSNVDAIFGDAKCVLGSETCELLVMEPGLPETFVYGGAGRTYTVELLKIHLVETDELNRAPLGEPPKKHGKGNELKPG